MTWVGMPVDIVERLERHGLSRDDRLLYVEGFLYAGQYLTDGTITPRLARISDHPDPNAAAQRLVEAEVWEQVDDGAFIVVDYFTANLTRDEIARRKEDARLRQERSRRHKAGDHSICVRGRYCPDGQDNGVTRDVTRDNTRESRPTYLPDLPDLPGKVREGKESAGDDTGRGSPNGSPAPASPPEATAAAHGIRQLYDHDRAQGEAVTIAGTIDTVDEYVTPEGSRWMTLWLTDSQSTVEVLVFPRLLENCHHLIREGASIVVDGRLNIADDDREKRCVTAFECVGGSN